MWPVGCGMWHNIESNCFNLFLLIDRKYSPILKRLLTFTGRLLGINDGIRNANSFTFSPFIYE